jgi:hypothetical protein
MGPARPRNDGIRPVFKLISPFASARFTLSRIFNNHVDTGYYSSITKEMAANCAVFECQIR